MVIPYQKCQSQIEALQAVKTMAPAMMQKFKVNTEIKDNGKDEIVAKGRGFTLRVHFNESQLQFKLDLSLLLRPLKGQVEGAIQRTIANVV